VSNSGTGGNAWLRPERYSPPVLHRKTNLEPDETTPEDPDTDQPESESGEVTPPPPTAAG
jgi:hypothetical protein